MPPAVPPEGSALTQSGLERQAGTDMATEMLPAHAGYGFNGRPNMVMPVEGYLYERGA